MRPGRRGVGWKVAAASRRGTCRGKGAGRASRRVGRQPLRARRGPSLAFGSRATCKRCTKHCSKSEWADWAGKVWSGLRWFKLLGWARGNRSKRQEFKPGFIFFQFTYSSSKFKSNKFQIRKCKFWQYRILNYKRCDCYTTELSFIDEKIRGVK